MNSGIDVVSIAKAADRFWKKVDIQDQDSCWLWLAGKTHNGYGEFYLDGKTRRASAVAYVLGGNELVGGELIGHKCDNPPCVNPLHLFATDHKQNSRDMVLKGRTNKGEDRYNAKLTESKVIEARVRFAGGETIIALAKEFGVSKGNMRSAIRGVRWKFAGGPILPVPPNSGGNRRSTKKDFNLENVLASAGRFWKKVDVGRSDECWSWKAGLSPDGYGMFWLCGKTRRASIVSAMLDSKSLIDPGLIVLHSCDHSYCVNPGHLSVGTHKDNALDRVSRARGCGEFNGSSKLSEYDVIKIREKRATGQSTYKLAQQYGVTNGNISNIVKGNIWKHVGGPLTTDFNSKALTVDKVNSVRALLSDNNMTCKEIADILNVGVTSVHRIRKNEGRFQLTHG